MTIFLAQLLKVLVIFGGLVGAAALSTLAERKVSAWIQLRMGPNRVGPNLYGVVGAEFGSKDFKYSANLLELKAEGRVWDNATLDAYLKKPKDVIPKGTMSFAGLAKDTDRANVIAYLASFGGAAAE